MLDLIGLGVAKWDISVRAMDELKKADIVFLEDYTSFIPAGYAEELEAATNKKFIRIFRKHLEDDVKSTIEPAKDRHVCILFPGDPLIATTHHVIIDAAKKQGTETRIFHSTSIFTVAIGESGLDIYRFGSTATVPYWTEKYKPISFLDVIARNLENNEHSLVLLDIKYAETRPMKLSEATQIISDANKKVIIRNTTEVMVLGDAGTANQKIIFTHFSRLPSLSREFDNRATSLIIPSNLNFAELEHVQKFML